MFIALQASLWAMETRDRSRRSVLQSVLTGTAGASALLAGCSGSDDGDSGTTPSEDITDPVPELDLVMYSEGQGSTLNTLGHMVADNMEEVGLQVNRREIPTENFIPVVAIDKDFDCVAFRYGSSLRRGDPNGFINEVHHGADRNVGEGGLNIAGYDNPEYNEVAESQMAMPDRQERQDLVHQAQTILARDQPYSYVATFDTNQPYRTDTVDNVTASMGGGLSSFWTLLEATTTGDSNVLRYGHNVELNTLNLLMTSGAMERLWAGLLFDKLYRLNEEGDPEPWAATEMPTIEDGGQTVTVPMRDDMTFHDGEPVDAEDAKFSFELFGEQSAILAPLMEPVDEVTVTGDYEVTFHLGSPFAPFVGTALAEIPIHPSHVWREVDEPGDASIPDDVAPIGSGPAEFVQWETSESLELQAWDDHFQAPAIDRLIRVPVSNVSTLVRMLEENELDMVGTTPTVTAQNRLADTDNVDLAYAQGLGWANIAHNFRREVMQDVYLRRAITHCVPKGTFVENVLDGVGSVTHTPIGEAYGVWHNPDVEEFTEDLDSARQELTDGGYGWNDNGRLHYTENYELVRFYADG